MTFLEALIATVFILLCISYKYLKSEFQHAVSKYISWIVITIPIGCYLITRLNLFTKDTQKFFDSFFPESIGIVFTFFIIETFHNYSLQKKADDQAYLAIIANYKNLYIALNKFTEGNILLFYRNDKREHSTNNLNSLKNNVDDQLNIVANADVNRFKGYYLPSEELERVSYAKNAENITEESYDLLINTIKQITSSLLPEFHGKMASPLFRILSNHSDQLYHPITTAKQQIFVETKEPVINMFIDKDFNQTRAFHTLPIINIANRNKVLCEEMIAALPELAAFCSAYEKKYTLPKTSTENARSL